MKRHGVVALVAVLTMGSALTIHADEYRLKKVDEARLTGQYKALVLDSAGLPHIIYWDQDGGLLKYAHKDERGKWHLSPILTPQYGYVYSSAIDDSGRLHFAFKGTEGEDTLYYCVGRDEWQTEAIDDSTGSAASLVVDSQYWPHITYYRGEAKHLMHAYRDGSGWHFENLGFGINPSSALDAGDDMHVVYQVPDQWELRYTGIPAIDDSVGPGGIPSVAVDSMGWPHVSCLYFGATRKLRYYWWDGVEWLSEDVDSLGRMAGSYFQLSSLDSPHIAYKTDKALKHASLNGSWEIEQIDTTMGTTPYLQLSEMDNPHVCYDSGTYSFLMYAWVPDSQHAKIFVDPDSFHFVYGSYITRAPAEDGISAGCFRDLNDPSWMEAVELPVAVQCSLTELQYYPCNAQNPDLHWKVWGDNQGRPGVLLAEGTESPVITNDWITIPISPRIPLDTGRVYVGWSVSGSPYYHNGRDAALEDTTNWWFNGASWIPDRYIPGNLLIRAELWVPEAHPVDTMRIMNDGYQVYLDVDSISYTAPWIESVSDTIFSLYHDSVQIVEIGVNAEGVPRGIYHDNLIVHSNDTGHPDYQIPIVFQVDTVLPPPGVEEEIQVAVPPEDFAIGLISPNPTREMAAISYSIPRREKMSLRVYNVLGELVRTLVDEEKEAGTYTSVWDGRDDGGRAVAPGVYWSILKTMRFSQARKVVLLR